MSEVDEEPKKIIDQTISEFNAAVEIFKTYI